MPPARGVLPWTSAPGIPHGQGLLPLRWWFAVRRCASAPGVPHGRGLLSLRWWFAGVRQPQVFDMASGTSSMNCLASYGGRELPGPAS